MGYNLAQLETQQKNRINIELSAAGVAFKERYGMPVNPELIEESHPAEAREWFRQRLNEYRKTSQLFSCLAWEKKK